MTDIATQRGTVAVGNAGGTTSPPTDFASVDSTIVWNRNNRHSHGGIDSETTSNVEGDDMSGGLHLASNSSIDVDREAASRTNTMRFSWESWEYTGTAGGVNEFIVRGRYKIDLDGVAEATQAVSGIVDIDRCVPIITGLLTDDPVDSWDNVASCAWMTAGTVNVRCGGGHNNIHVYVTVVEFTGSNWSIAHGRQESPADSGTIQLVDAADGLTGSGGDIADWSTATIHAQWAGNQLNGVDDSISDTSATYGPATATDQVDWAFNGNHTDSASAGDNGVHIVHVIGHADMAVTRYTNTNNGVSTTIDITSAGLTDLGASSIVATRSSSGNGTAYARGWVNANLLSLTSVQLWVHRSGNSISSKLEVMDLTAIVAAPATVQRYVLPGVRILSS